jgi:hypothetical protein
MKLAALYTVWNGLELLNGSIDQIKNDVDIIFIGWQWRSNKGERSNEIENFLSQYDNDPKIVLIEFIPNFKNNTKKNELDKHNHLLEAARSEGCSHFVLLATDHYYEPEQFKATKEMIIERGCKITVSKMFTYYKRPEWRLDPPELYYMPFICEIAKDTRFEFSGRYPVTVDPSLKLFPISVFYALQPKDLIMHHYSMIREDIENKFNNAAASIRWTPEKIETFTNEYKGAELGDSIQYFGGRKLIAVENFFNI